MQTCRIENIYASTIENIKCKFRNIYASTIENIHVNSENIRASSENVCASKFRNKLCKYVEYKCFLNWHTFMEVQKTFMQVRELNVYYRLAKCYEILHIC